MAITQQNKVVNVPDIVLSPRDTGGAKSVVLTPVEEAPGKAQAPYKAAVKALDANETDEGIKQLLLAVKAVPKFADGWNILGAVYEQHQQAHGSAGRSAARHRGQPQAAPRPT